MSDIIKNIKEQLEGMESYAIVTSPTNAAHTGLVNMFNKVAQVLAPYTAEGKSSHLFRGAHLCEKTGRIGVHFYAKAEAAQAVAKAFDDYTLINRAGDEVTFNSTPPSGPKR